MKQGTQANLNGSKLEATVQETITDTLMCEAKYYSRHVGTCVPFRNNTTLWKNVPYKNIYGNKRCRSEFVLRKHEIPLSNWDAFSMRTIRIECKYQNARGSVDEKLPYLADNFLNTIEEKEAVIVIEGKGFKEGAVEWLREKCKGTKVQVFDLVEFYEWCDLGMPKPKLSIRNRISAWVKSLQCIIDGSSKDRLNLFGND
jgi:hypothetical protein